MHDALLVLAVVLATFLANIFSSGHFQSHWYTRKDIKRFGGIGEGWCKICGKHFKGKNYGKNPEDIKW